MPVLVDLPLPLFVQALAVALAVAVVSGWAARLFSRRKRGEDGGADRWPEDR